MPFKPHRLITFGFFRPALILLSVIASSCDDKEEVPTPVITSFNPTNGIAGTEVIIQGKNFQINASENQVTISNVAASITTATTETLHVIVPAGAVTGRIVVSNNSGKSVTSSTDFTVFDKVTFTGFSPHTGEAGTTINISGGGFSTTPTNNVVTIGGVSATVITASPALIIVTAPLSGVTGVIEVKVNGQTITTTDAFQYIPKITQLSPAISSVGSEIVISGSGFSPVIAKNKVFFQGLAGTVLEATANTIKVRIPVDAKTGPVNIESDGHQLTGPICTIVFEAASAGGPGYDQGQSIVVDASGNFYIAGTFSNTAWFGDQSITSPNSDFFIAKYSSEGKIIWVRRGGGTGNAENVTSAIIDGAGNLYVVGLCGADAVFGSITLSGGPGGFIAKLNPSGDFLWARKFASNSPQMTSVDDVTFDTDNNPILIGTFAGKITIGTKTIEAPNGSSAQPPTNPFMVKLNTGDGSAMLVKQFETGNTSGHGGTITRCANNDLIIAGSFFKSATFGATTFTSPTATDLDAFIMRTDKAGELIWIKQFGGTGWENIYDVKLDQSEDIIVTGYFGSQLNGPGISLTATGGENFFVTKLSSTGSAKWSSAGSSNSAIGNAVAIDATGDIYAAGYFYNDIAFNGQTTIADPHSRQMMLIKYDTDGNMQWFKQGGGTDDDNAYAVAIDPDGFVLMTGYIRQQSATLGHTLVTNAGNDDVFWWRVAK